LAKNLTLEARYIASKSTKLLVGIPLNDVNIFENRFLEAFNATRAGDNASMFDQMLRGLNFGTTTGPLVVNGTTVTGSAALRQNTQTRAFIANGDVGQLADFLNRNATITGQGGGILRNSGLFPENFFVVNPQFNTVRLDSNPGNSTYHSMQLQITKRLSGGFTNQTSYVWSRTLGESSDDGSATYLNPRNRSLNKSLLDFHRTHSILSNGTYELPFGPGRSFLTSAPAIVTRLVEQWQLGGVFNWTSGAPINITATTSSFTQATGNNPIIVGNFPKNVGHVTPDSNGGTYFPGFSQSLDTATRDRITNLQSLQAQFSNQVIKDANGNLVLMNPAPGQLGTLGQQWIEGPARIGLDVNLVKRVRVDESKSLEIRFDVVNLLNTPRWNLVTGGSDINNLNFGRMTAADPTGSFAQADTITAARRFSVNARFNF
jgi:hypothetical protein